MKKSTKFTVAALASTIVGSIVYMSEKAAKKIVKKEPLESIELDELKEKRIRNQKGQTITGYLANRNKNTTMIILHTLRGSGVDMISYYDYFKNKIDANYLLIDLAGYGKSEGDHIMLDESYEDDLLSWIDYCRRNDQTNIILYGKQFGANVILNSLKELDRIENVKCIISDGATASNDQMIQDEINQMYPLLKRTISLITKLIMKFQYHIPFKHLNILENLKNYQKPILFVQAKNDPLVSFKRVFNIYNAKSNQKELILLKDEAYLYEYDDVNAPYYEAMFNFINEQL